MNTPAKLKYNNLNQIEEMADCYSSKKGIPGEKPKCTILSGGV